MTRSRTTALSILVLAATFAAPPAAGLSPHAPIAAFGDASLLSLAASEGWPGDGSLTDPIVIEGYSIAGADHAIWLHGITLAVTIRGNEVSAAATGNAAIHVIGASRALVSGNTVHGVNVGIAFNGVDDARAIGNDVAMTASAAQCVLLVGTLLGLVEDNDLTDCGGSGVALVNAPRTRVATNRIQRVVNGIAADPVEGSAFVSNVVSSTTGQGIALSGGGSGVDVIGNTVTDVGGHGITVDAYNAPGAHTDLRIQQNTLARGPNVGILLVAGGVGSIDRALVAQNDLSAFGSWGIGVFGTSRVTLEANTVHDSRGPGLVVWGARDVAILDNDVARVGADPSYAVGIGAILGTTGVARGNEVDATSVGIHVAAASGVTLTENVVTRSDWGILVDGQSAGPLSATAIHDNAVATARVGGIALFGATDSVVERNDVAGAGAFGIVLEGSTPSERNIVRDNRVHDGAGHGIGEGNPRSSANLIEANLVERVGGWGLFGITSSGPVAFRDNVVQDALQGVVLGQRANALVDGNTIANSSSIGLYLGTGVTLSDFTRNRVTGSGYASLLLENAVTRNRIWDNQFLASPTGAEAIVVNSPDNLWNVTPVAGMNVIGGPTIAGNAWGDLVGVDVDGNGVSEIPYLLPGITVDVDALNVTRLRLDALLNPPFVDFAPLMRGVAVVGLLRSATLDATGVPGPNPRLALPRLDPSPLPTAPALSPSWPVPRA